MVLVRLCSQVYFNLPSHVSRGLVSLRNAFHMTVWVRVCDAGVEILPWWELAKECAAILKGPRAEPGCGQQAGRGYCKRERCDTASLGDKTAMRSVFSPATPISLRSWLA